VGPHTLKLKAFDTSNNPGESTISFFVSDDIAGSIKALINYPNPFTNQTTFRFEHELNANSFALDIRIFDLKGNFVHQISEVVSSSGNTVDGIEWDGTIGGHTNIPNGIYIYHIVIRPSSSNEEISSEFKKLVILK
jgi:hypothetical protein